MTVADARIWRTVDGDYVAEGDPAAAFLVCGVGGEAPDDFKGFAKVENKMVEPPPNKGRKADK